MKNTCMHEVVRELGALFNEGAIGMLSDGQLLDRFVELHEAWAFEAIVERYGPLVWGVCGRVLRDHHDAEDAFQATFLVLARRAASIMPREKIGNWLYGVAYQTAMKARATRAKRRVRERPAWEMTEPEAVPDDYADELLSRLDREVTRLPEKYRVPIILCELQGKTHREAAEQLGWPVGTVSGRLSRARAVLASRLSRGAAPLAVGALGGLLAHDMARAGVPAELVRSAAQAGTLSTAGKAVTAGVVSAQVAALTEEVLKTMLINKLTLATAMLLVVVALAGGATSLTYRAQSAEPANQRKDSEKPTEQPKPIEAKNQPKSTEATKEDKPTAAAASTEEVGRPKEPVARGAAEPAPLAEEQWQRTNQRMLECGGYSFTATRTGNAAVAYNPATREVKAVRLGATSDHPLWVTPVAVDAKNPQLVALGVRGERISRVAVFNLRLGKWTPLKLDQPVTGAVWPMSIGPQTAAYEVGDFLYLFNPNSDVWDRLDVRTLGDDNQETGEIRGR
jgi:RNA polymerase sigma-70 factor (ECF subfamily)